MNTSKIYYDSNGDEKTIYQMIKYEPDWVASRFQFMEQQNEEMIEALKMCYNHIKNNMQICGIVETTKQAIEKATGKKIKEVI